VSTRGTAFVPTQRPDLDRVFAFQNERVVNRDNTASWANRISEIDKTSWRASLAGCRVIIYEHLDGTVTVGYGPHTVGRFTAEGMTIGSFSSFFKSGHFIC
jgi:hypothetical protein